MDGREDIEGEVSVPVPELQRVSQLGWFARIGSRGFWAALRALTVFDQASWRSQSVPVRRSSHNIDPANWRHLE